MTTVNYRHRNALQLKNGSREKDGMCAPLNRLAFSARPPPTRANNRPDPAKNPLVGPPPPALTRCSCCANRLQLSWFIVEVGGRAAKGRPSRYRTRSAALTTVDGSARQRLLSAMAGGAFSPRNHLDLAPVDFDSLPRSTCLLFGDLHLECTRIGAFAYLLPGICQAWRSTVIRSSAISYAISLECNSTRLI